MALNTDLIRNAVDRYYARHPEEDERATPFLSYLDSNQDLISRTNFAGHLTTSGFVIHNDDVLLIHHNRLQRYLQPGGHIEGDENLAASAAREVMEETGIGSLQLIGDDTLPFDIDPHKIPASEKRAEPEHYHFDFRFLFRIDGDPALNLQLEEVSAAKWISPRGKDFLEYIGNPTTQKLQGHLSSS